MSIASSNVLADSPHFRVNSHTAGDQRLSQATALSNGSFYVTWTSTDQDGDRYGVYGQLFDADGQPIGAETRINTYTRLDQTLPQVTAYGDGNFVVVWQSFAQDETVYESYPNGNIYNDNAYQMQYGIFGQRFDSTGAPIGNEFQVNTTSRDDQHNAQVIALPDGGYIVAWLNYFSHITYTGEHFGSHRFQRYDANGTPVGGEVILDTYPPQGDLYSSYEGGNPEYTVTNNGTLVMTWGNVHRDLYIREFDLDGTPLIDPQLENPLILTSGSNSSIAALADGGYVISIVRGSAQQTISARMYDVGGTPRGDEFVVFDSSSYMPNTTQIVALHGGGFVVAWANIELGIRAQLYDSSGVEVGPVALLSAEIFGKNDFDITILSDDRLLVTSIGFDLTEGTAYHNPNDVFGQIFEISGFGITTLFNNRANTVTLSDIENNVRAMNGDDIVTGGSLRDTIRGESGNDTLNGEGGDDRLFGGTGNDTINGGIGADHIGGGIGDDTLNGGLGDDEIFGDEGDDLIHGNDGDDYIEGGFGDNTIYGDAGNDVILSRESVIMTQTQPSDTYGTNRLYGGDGDDFIRGHFGHDFLYGGNGNDQLLGGSGNDYIDGGAGDDIINGNNGVDIVLGGDGNDTIYVGFDGSQVFAGAGDDTVYVTPSFSGVAGQIIDGGSGVNTLAFENTGAYMAIATVDMVQLFIAARTEHSYLNSYEQSYENFSNILVRGNYHTVVIGDDAANRILNNGTGGGSVRAGGGDDYIEGSRSADILWGNDGDDVIIGGRGNDQIAGNAGINTLSGGRGADEFIFDTLDAMDTISDFEIRRDSLNLSALLYQAEEVSISLNGVNLTRFNCFNDYDVDAINLQFVQNGANTEIYLNDVGLNPSLPNTGPLIVLEGIDVTTLTFDHILF